MLHSGRNPVLAGGEQNDIAKKAVMGLMLLLEGQKEI